MRASATTVPIEHSRVVHWVRTTRTHMPHTGDVQHPDGGFGHPEPAAERRGRAGSSEYTLLELVEAIADVTDDDREIVATVIHLLASGQVRLCGNFRDEPVELFLAS
jgi:hypothetical protein